jgi:hypothetical protein
VRGARCLLPKSPVCCKGYGSFTRSFIADTSPITSCSHTQAQAASTHAHAVSPGPPLTSFNSGDPGAHRDPLASESATAHQPPPSPRRRVSDGRDRVGRGSAAAPSGPVVLGTARPNSHPQSELSPDLDLDTEAENSRL